MGYQNITGQEQEEVKPFLDDCIITDINNQIKEEVIRIKQSPKVKLPESIILATSKYLNIFVISSDSNFSKAHEVNVIYYEKE